MKLNKKLMASAAVAVCVSVTMTSMAFAQGYTKKTFSEDFEQTADADKFNDGYINQDDVSNIIKTSRAGAIPLAQFESSKFKTEKQSEWLTVGENSKGKWSLYGEQWLKGDGLNRQINNLACINDGTLTESGDKISDTDYVFSGYSNTYKKIFEGYRDDKKLHITAANKRCAQVRIEVKDESGNLTSPKNIKKLSYDFKSNKATGVRIYASAPNVYPSGENGSSGKYIEVGTDNNEHKFSLKIMNGTKTVETVTGPKLTAWNTKAHVDIEFADGKIALSVKDLDNNKDLGKAEMQISSADLKDLMDKAVYSVAFYSSAPNPNYESPIQWIDNVNIEYFDGNEPGYQIDNTNNKIYFNLKPSELNSAAAAGTKEHVLYATYDESKLVDVQIKDVDAVSSAIESLEFELNNQTGTKSKFYVWSGSVSDCKPLCAPVPVE